MTPFCFLMTPDGDVDTRFLFTADLATYVKQRLRENLSFFLGEWFLDTRQGLPYFQRILGFKYDAGLLDQIFRKAALATIGVASVDSLQSTFNRKTRTLSIPVFKCTLTDGSTITQDDLDLPFIVSVTNTTQLPGGQ